MLNVDELQGKWTAIRGKLKEKWGQLTDDDLKTAGGNVEQLIGRIQARTGEGKKAIEDLLTELVDDSTLTHAREAATEVAQEAARRVRAGAERIQEGYGQVREQVQEGYDAANQMVRDRPATSLAVVFGSGLVAGLVVGLLLRSDA